MAEEEGLRYVTYFCSCDEETQLDFNLALMTMEDCSKVRILHQTEVQETLAGHACGTQASVPKRNLLRSAVGGQVLLQPLSRTSFGIASKFGSD